MSNSMQLTYSADGTDMYMPLGPPTSSPSPSPTPAYNNPNGAGGEGGYAGESNSAAAGIGASGAEAGKRKRGRPRKYAPGDSTPLTVTSTSKAPPGYEAAESSDMPSPVSSSAKKARGRPPGSGNRQQTAASGSPGAGFMPHVLDVKAGEDVLEKLMRFSQHMPRAFCILSAGGAISSVRLQQTATSGGTVTYEGRFEILSLKGSCAASESREQHNRMSGLTVALAGPDGRVLGGNVAGLLIAASPVKVIIGSFIPAIQKQAKAGGNNEGETTNAPVNPVSGTSAGGGSPSESSGGELGSPIDHSHNSNPQGMASMPWR